VVNSTRVAAFSGLNDGLRLTRYDGFRERFIPLGKTSQPTSDVPQLGPPAVVLHVDDSTPSNNRLHRSAHLSTGNGFKAGVRNPDGSAKNSGCIENQGGKEKSRG